MWDRNTDIWFAGLHDPWTETFGEAQLTTTDNMSLCPSIAWTGTEYGVVWGDQRGGDTEAEIYFALVDATGSRVGGEVRVTSAAGWSLSPRVVWTGTEFGAVWLDTRDGSEEVYFARMSAGGAKLAGRCQNHPRRPLPLLQPLACLDRVGVRRCLVRCAGRKRRDLLRADQRRRRQTGPRGPDHHRHRRLAVPVARVDGVRAHLAWEDSRNGNCEIYFARISDAGVKQGNDVLVTTDDAYDSANPSLVASGSTYGLAWQDRRDEYPPGRFEIYFAILEADGDRR